MFLVGNSVSLAGTGFVFWIIAARRFSPEDVGLATTLISLTSIIAILSTAGLELAMLRFLPVAGDVRRYQKLLNTAMTTCALVAAVAAAVFLFVSPAISAEFAEEFADVRIQLAVIVFVVAQSVNFLIDSALTAVGASHITLMRNVGANALKLALIFFIPVGIGAIAIVASNSIPLVFIVVGSVLLLFPLHRPGYRFGPDLHLGSLSELTQFALIAHLSNLFFLAPQYLLPAFVLNSLGPADAAFMYTAWRIAGLVWIVTTAASGPLLAYGAANPDQYWRKLRSVGLVVLGGTAVAAVVLVLARGPILHLYGNEYAEGGSRSLVLLAASSVPLGVFSLYLTTLRARGRARELLGASFVFGLVSVLSYAAAGRAATIEAFGWAWLSATAVMAAVALFRLLKLGASGA